MFSVNDDGFRGGGSHVEMMMKTMTMMRCFMFD